MSDRKDLWDHEAVEHVFLVFFFSLNSVNRCHWSEIKLALHCYMESNVSRIIYLILQDLRSLA